MFQFLPRTFANNPLKNVSAKNYNIPSLIELLIYEQNIILREFASISIID